MICTLSLTLPSGATRSATVSSKQPYALVPGTALGVFYIADPASDEFAVWMQNGAIDEHGNPVGTGFDYEQIDIIFDKPTDSVDARMRKLSSLVYAFVAPALHYLPWSGQTIRRFIPTGGRFSTRTGIYDGGPLKTKRVDLPTSKDYWSKRAQRLRTAVSTGKADKAGLDLWRDQVALFFTPGDPENGAPAGGKIFLEWGYGDDPNECWFNRQYMDLMIDRERTACFDAATGAQMTAEMWVARRLSVPGYRTEETALKPVQSSQSPEFLPLQKHTTDNDEHFCRAFIDAIATWRQYKDPVAKMFLGQLAHHSRGAKCDLPGGRLYQAMQTAMANPGTASANIGRAMGHHAKLMAAAMWAGVADDGIRANAAMCVKLFETSAMSSGFVGRNTSSKSSGGIRTPWDQHAKWKLLGKDVAWGEEFDHVQSFEVWIAHDGWFAILAQTYPDFGTPPGRLRRILGAIHPDAKAMLHATDNLTRNDSLKVWPYQYNKYSLSPPHFVVVADAGGAAHRKPFMGYAFVTAPGALQTDTGDPSHLLHALALAYRMSGDAVYLDRIRALDVPSSTLAVKKMALRQAFVQMGSDQEYQAADQGRAWGVQALSVLP